ncbi:ROK family transcriptional regulator [Pelagimonas varians]|uniref:N-acetylglucosamine repressor n=1 Tax=Pelagimonas varians TaxID=696760 RepID=A0A238KGD5_9RHOB|nr:ROK family transcriptional regulator [Pelagimonas varians]PYG32369.1 putative NBD/HSP70 family sugar kinase [Pelagimonas varians]SMX41604.1 N-acetylglucosamine repressor [Pelagimonas varians]
MAQTDKNNHNSDQREAGRLQVLDAIRSAGTIARIDIAGRTGFSPATVTVITAQLLEAGLIEEVTPEPNEKATGIRRGRPRVSLRLRGQAHRVAGLKVSHNNISVLILDFEGTEILSHEMTLPETRMATPLFCSVLIEAVTQACAKGSFTINDLSGIGVALSGLVDAKRRFVYWSSSLTDRNVNLGAELDSCTPCPVFLDNDANLVAKAEHLFGEGRDVDDFIVVTIEHGVGMGIVLDGEIYRGTRGCGAEFGHTKVQLEGALCQCGQRGCLEAYVGNYALLREANIMDRDRPLPDVPTLFNRAQSGDMMARSIFDRAGRMFAMGLANLVNIFDPKLIILAGERLSFDYLHADTVLEEMRRSVVQVDAPLPEVRVHAWGDHMWAKGAAAYAIEQVSAQAVREASSDAA